MLVLLLSNILLSLPDWRRGSRIITTLSLAGFLLLSPSIALSADITASELILLTNQERASLGLPELTPNHKLTQAAAAKAADLLEKSYFSHTTPEGKPFYEWIEDSGYRYLYAGENLAIDFLEPSPVVAAWMESPAHRANIVHENYTDIGIAVLRGAWQGRPTAVVVQLFGSELSNEPTVLGKHMESLSASLLLRRESLKALAADAVLLPSLAGRHYFDVLIRPDSYQTLVLAAAECCEANTTFALTVEQDARIAGTPISYPTVLYLLGGVTKRTASIPAFPQTLNTNLAIAGILALLLLAAFEAEIRREFEQITAKK
ncbi:MAG: CAP domain-containing protein [Patescibacteria group bacterium]|nr:CAP domain-containing protein [Patescibacteria group bacterium]